MHSLINYIANNGIKCILIAKLAIISAIAANYFGGFYVGDKFLSAQESKVENRTNDDSDQTSMSDTGELVKKRRGFLEDLLELPKLETAGLKKEEIGRYLGLIDKKKGQIEGRIAQLNKREVQLIGLERTIDEKLRKLEEEIDFFKQTLQKEKVVKQKRLEMLVEFYKKMPPKKAAPVFEDLDRDLVVALFNRIPDKQVTQILSLMDPKKSVAISEYYGRIGSTGEYDLLKEINTSLREEFDLCKGVANENDSDDKIGEIKSANALTE